jgi:hypothetical protein
MITLLLAVGILASLQLIAGGPTLMALGPRWRDAWPLVAPPVGLALLVVVGEVPSQLVGARTWAPVCFALLVLAGVATLVLRRRDLRRRDLFFLALPVLVLPWTLLPYFSEPILTTLSEHNHDYVYYHALELQLLEGGYGAGEGDVASLFDRLGWVLRRGGWRAGLPIAGSAVAAVTGLLPHQVDGALWGLCHAMFPGAVLAATRLLVPRGSTLARTYVFVGALASGPALVTLRMTFASHLASLPLFVLLWALMFRGLRARAFGLRGLAALLLAASISILADALPYLLAMLAWALLVQWRLGAPRIPLERLAPRIGVVVGGIALVPFALWRIYLSIVSLTITGYHQPAAEFSATLPNLIGPALSLAAHPAQTEGLHPLAQATLLGAAGLGGAFVLLAAMRTRSAATRRAVGAPLLLSAVLALAAAPFGYAYPLWKLAITTSPFVLVALAAGFDRLARPIARRVGTWMLAGQAATVLYASLLVEVEPHGVRAMHEALVNRVIARSDAPYLVGHHGPDSVRHEHALVYLFRTRGSVLRANPHPSSYFWVSWPTPQLAAGDPGSVAIVVDPERAIVEGRALFDTPVGTVFDVDGGYAANVALLEGFEPYEHEPGRSFAWSDRSSRLAVELPLADGCLTAEARSIPDGTARSLVVAQHAVPEFSPVPDYEVPWQTIEAPLSLDWQEVVIIPPGGPNVQGASLRYAGIRAEPRVDARSIYFALAGFRVRSREDCAALGWTTETH